MKSSRKMQKFQTHLIMENFNTAGKVEKAEKRIARLRGVLEIIAFQLSDIKEAKDVARHALNVE